MRDKKHIEQNFHSVARVMHRVGGGGGWDGGGGGGGGGGGTWVLRGGSQKLVGGLVMRLINWALSFIFIPPKELWEAYSNHTVRPSSFCVQCTYVL